MRINVHRISGGLIAYVRTHAGEGAVHALRQSVELLKHRWHLKILQLHDPVQKKFCSLPTSKAKDTAYQIQKNIVDIHRPILYLCHQIDQKLYQLNPQ